VSIIIAKLTTILDIKTAQKYKIGKG